MGNANWDFDELLEPSTITVDQFSGIFALVDITMSYSHYWITQALDNVQPELDDPQEQFDGEFDD
jgi:hypothetical protein